MIDQYWISPNAVIIEIKEHPVKSVIDEPRIFGYSEEELLMIYAKYNDVNQAEGEATKTIIKDLVYKGWTYCFRKNHGKVWKIEVYKLDKKTRFNLRVWSVYLIKNQLISMITPIKFYRHLKKDKLNKTISQLMEDDLFTS